MSRYGWSDRPQLSPYNSTLGGGSIPAVTDEDFSYITSEDLENIETRRPLDHTSRYGTSHSPRSSTGRFGHSAPDRPEDDVLLLKNKGVTYPEHFPAYSIGDGILLVEDVVDRIKLVMKLSDRQARRLKLLYKGRQLKDLGAPIRQYGVKNNSEIMVVLEDAGPNESSESSEEVVVVGREDAERRKPRKRRGKKRDSARDSPRDSGSNVGSTVGSSAGLEVPRGADGRGGSASRAQSPASGVSVASSAATAPGGPMDKLDAISAHFRTKLLPQCVQFTANPPANKSKREEEHRKISETIMQQVLLKLDAIDTLGEDEVRAKRRELVREVQDVLKGLDKVRDEGP
ncbi:hypothetical protein VTK73DRAFT_6263 [Phialemonium thermophilum]|uniref:BAG domain-containing protein n=1 Tax=Phialemonium thermophilum TaxID=223376 RepID=A0ABR3WKD9_9PEZI